MLDQGDDWPFANPAYGAVMEPGTAEVLLIDFPWHFKPRSVAVQNPHISRATERHYRTMSKDDLIAFCAHVKRLAAKDCHGYFWTTGTQLEFAFPVMRACGFRYSSLVHVWVKAKKTHRAAQLRMIDDIDHELHFGMGLTSRQNVEPVLLGRRGSPRRVARNVRQVIFSPVREHSRKPDEIHDRIERYVGPGLRMVELFGRQERPGWQVWGDQVRKFNG